MASRTLEDLARKYGVTADVLLAYVRAEIEKEEARKNSSSFFGTGSRAGKREWHGRGPPPAEYFETSSAYDGPRREGVTTITIATNLVCLRTYQWNAKTASFPKPGIGRNKWNLFRTVAIDGLKDLISTSRP